jgi:shikimate kinase
MNVVLIGYRCSGKTSVGQILSQRLKRNFVDTDVLIEGHTRCSIEEIVSRHGWAGFRDMERTVIEEVSGKDNLIIAPGGGAVMDRRNVRDLKRNGWIVWLRGSLEDLLGRMNEEMEAGKIRPSLTGTDPREEIAPLLRIREPVYGAVADMTVETSGLEVREVAERIQRALRKHSERMSHGR